MASTEIPENVFEYSATEVIDAIRSKRLTARQYITAVLDRAQQTKSLNAFISMLPDEALLAANRLDKAIASNETLPPLAGLAIVVKDCINMAGIPCTAGTPALQNSRPTTTAPSVQALLDAGAIVIGKTNMHELACGITSSNLASFAGPVRNPYAPDKIPGGSSGGTAVAVAAGVVTCGLGTDTGGSTRIPAALTGTVGLRPSVGNGTTERRYHDENAVVPISHTRDTVGPMGRSVADVALLDSVITGNSLPQASNLEGVRIGIPPILWKDLDHQLEEVVITACQKLSDAGVILVDADIPDLLAQDDKISLILAFYEAKIDVPAYLIASGITDVSLNDIITQIASPDVAGFYSHVMSGAMDDKYEDALKIGRPALQQIYTRYFEENNVDAILFPTTILPATQIDTVQGSGEVKLNGKPIDAFSAYIKLTSPGSVAGIPGLSIPAGITPDGLPVGLEIDGLVGSDEKLLSLGLSLEKILGKVPPPQGLYADDTLSQQ